MPALPSGKYTTFDVFFAGGSAPGVNPYSARGLRGTLSPIDMARGEDKLARTVNGTLVDISAPQMRKYKLQISGSDDAPPALDGIWVGMMVTVNSLVELAFLTSGGSPERTPVSGSSRIEGNYTYYRPSFTMRVVEHQIESEEWAATVPWSLTLEEV
jgi:hypothetical protein